MSTTKEARHTPDQNVRLIRNELSKVLGSFPDEQTIIGGIRDLAQAKFAFRDSVRELTAQRASLLVALRDVETALELSQAAPKLLATVKAAIRDAGGEL